MVIVCLLSKKQTFDNLLLIQAAKAWSRKSKGGDAETESGISSSSSKEPMSACTPAKNSTGLMSWLKLNKEGPPEHQGVSIDHNLFLWKYAWKGLIAR